MISQDLKALIDKAVSRDFIIHEICEEDKSNDSYKALSFTLSFNNIKVEYERKVETSKYPVIPQFQYLLGFNPEEGLCLFVNKEEHKKALCDGPLEDISSSCSMVHSLMYLLVPTDKFEVYSYLPACCELNCANSPKQYDLRINLFEKEQ
jgi:hypothetical protein